MREVARSRPGNCCWMPDRSAASYTVQPSSTSRAMIYCRSGRAWATSTLICFFAMVLSSTIDLSGPPHRGIHQVRGHAAQQVLRGLAQQPARQLKLQLQGYLAGILAQGLESPPPRQVAKEIGRASCRERVERTGVAGQRRSK